MCTILTVDRFTFDQYTTEFLGRIEEDARNNPDGWSVVLLGQTKQETTLLKSLELESVMDALETIPWTRAFIHSRLATTSAAGIFGCHNFTTVGNGHSQNVKNGYWIVQHNGILSSPESYGYAVDSMYITEYIRAFGIKKAIDYLTKTETYANTFLINPLSARYIVTRAKTNTLYTDGLGNYSTRQVGPLTLEVPQQSHDEFHHFYDRKVEPPDMIEQVGGYDSFELWEQEIELHANNIEKEVSAWGDETLKTYNQNLELFAVALQRLGYVQPRKKLMDISTFKELDIHQRRWAMTLGVKTYTPRTAKK